MTKTQTILVFILAAVLLYFGGKALYKAGYKNAVTQELDKINTQLQQTPAQRSTDHINLLAKRKALQEILSKL